MKLTIKVHGYDETVNKGTIEIESGDTIKLVNTKILNFYRDFKVKHGGDKVPPADANFLTATWLNEMDFCVSPPEWYHFVDKASLSIKVKDWIRLATCDDDMTKIQLLRDYSVEDVTKMVLLYKSIFNSEKRMNEMLCGVWNGKVDSPF